MEDCRVDDCGVEDCGVGACTTGGQLSALPVKLPGAGTWRRLADLASTIAPIAATARTTLRALGTGSGYLPG